MQKQKRDSWCGPAALRNAVSCYGENRVSQKRIAHHAGTTDEGSDEHDLIRAIDMLGFVPHEIDTDDDNEARRWLEHRSPCVPLVLCVDRWLHWVAVTGQCAGRVMVVDTEHPHTLVQPTRVSRLMKRWRASRAQRSEGGLYYGIAVLRKQ
ncbi:MAG: cysteine peptidase family C39 domain-containing protein [Nannocystaceae bacterium]